MPPAFLGRPTRRSWAVTAGRRFCRSPASLATRRRCPNKARTPVCLVALSSQALQPRSGAPKAQGLRARRGPNDNLARRDDAQKLGMAHCPPWDPHRSPGGDSLLFALRCSDRRRIGGVGAGRSHPHSGRRTASRMRQAGSLARVPPRPSLAEERRRRDGGSREKLRRYWRCLFWASKRRHWNTCPPSPHGVQHDCEFPGKRYPRFVDPDALR
jgi:hypothetical protein